MSTVSILPDFVPVPRWAAMPVRTGPGTRPLSNPARKPFGQGLEPKRPTVRLASGQTIEFEPVSPTNPTLINWDRWRNGAPAPVVPAPVAEPIESAEYVPTDAEFVASQDDDQDDPVRSLPRGTGLDDQAPGEYDRRYWDGFTAGTTGHTIRPRGLDGKDLFAWLDGYEAGFSALQARIRADAFAERSRELDQVGVIAAFRRTREPVACWPGVIPSHVAEHIAATRHGGHPAGPEFDLACRPE